MDIIYYIFWAVMTVAYLIGAGFLSFAWSNGDQAIANRFGTLFIIILALVVWIVTGAV